MGFILATIDQYIIQKPTNLAVDGISNLLGPKLPVGTPLSNERLDSILDTCKKIGRTDLKDLKSIQQQFWLKPVEYFHLSTILLARKVYFFLNALENSDGVKESISQEIKDRVIATFKDKKIDAHGDTLKSTSEDALNTPLKDYSYTPSPLQLTSFLAKDGVKSLLQWGVRYYVTSTIVSSFIPEIGNLTRIVSVVGLYGLTMAMTPSMKTELINLEPFQIELKQIFNADVKGKINTKVKSTFGENITSRNFAKSIEKLEFSYGNIIDGPFPSLKEKKQREHDPFAIKEEITPQWLAQQIKVLNRNLNTSEKEVALNIYKGLKEAMDKGKNLRGELRGNHQGFVDQEDKFDLEIIAFAKGLIYKLNYFLPPEQKTVTKKSETVVEKTKETPVVVSSPSSTPTPRKPTNKTPSLVTSPAAVSNSATSSPKKGKEKEKEKTVQVNSDSEEQKVEKKPSQPNFDTSDNEGSKEESGTEESNE